MRHATLWALLALLPFNASAQAGSLDPAFGTSGKVVVPTLGAGNEDNAVTAVVLPGDKILVAGRSSNGGFMNSVLLRFNADGTPDLSFGTNGVVQHDLALGSEFIRSSAVDAQGRLVVGGHFFSDVTETNSDMFIARFLPDGSLDATFNGTGLVIRDLHSTPDAEEAYEVLLQPDGKIVLCGFTGPDPAYTELVVERYLDDGSFDPSFGGDGSVIVGIGDGTAVQVRGAVLGAGGHIYFCGYGTRVGETVESLLLGHVDTDGNWPSTFGNSNGHSWVSSTGNDMVGRTIAVTPSGDILVAGVRRNTGATQARIIHAFNTLGIEQPYSSYEDNSNGADAWNSLLVQNNGAILAGGNWADGPSSRNWSVTRQMSDLGSDPTFASVDYDEDGGAETCFHLNFFSDSSVLAIGTAEVAGDVHIALLKYLNDITSGVPDDLSSPGMTAMPNPTTNRTIISLEHGLTAAIHPELVDARGAHVHLWSYHQMGQDRLDLDLSALPVGVYTLRVNGAVLRLVKQ